VLLSYQLFMVVLVMLAGEFFSSMLKQYFTCTLSYSEHLYYVDNYVSK